MRRKIKVTVVYKNGAVVRFRCRKFTSQRATISGNLTAVEWDRAKPRPFLFGIDDVAAIYVSGGTA